MLIEVKVPDIGNYSNVDIIELLVQVGDTIAKEASLITLETDKATMEIPSPYAGIIKSINVKPGDKVSSGDLILNMEVAEDSAASATTESKDSTESKESTESAQAKTEELKTQEPKPQVSKTQEQNELKQQKSEEAKEQKKTGDPSKMPHAGPGVRRFARELGVDLTRVGGSGRKERILIADVQQYVKTQLKQLQSGSGILSSASNQGGMGLQLNLPPWPDLDHAQFGNIKKEPLSRIKKLSGSYLHRNWLMVPHITQFDEADITELEHFRKQSQALADEGVKLTPLVFIMKAVTRALQEFPFFNSSLDSSGTELILKQYFHLGVAVDTPNGLVVPVVRNVDEKGLFQLAKELGEISQKARKGQLVAKDMQGSSFSISSLGGIGGTAFTPIINVPDVAILGVSKAQMKPIYSEGEFKPRLMLPLSLSYDHRVIDGAEAARFITYLSKQLSDIRRLLL